MQEVKVKVKARPADHCLLCGRHNGTHRHGCPEYILADLRKRNVTGPCPLNGCDGTVQENRDALLECDVCGNVWRRTVGPATGLVSMTKLNGVDTWVSRMGWKGKGRFPVSEGIVYWEGMRDKMLAKLNKRNKRALRNQEEPDERPAVNAV